MQVMQVINPRQAALLPRQLVSLLPGQIALLPRQAAPPPQPGRNAGSVGAQSHTTSTSSQASGGSSPLTGISPKGSYPHIFQELSPQRREHTLEHPRYKWAINISSKPVTQAQRSLLFNRPNYMVTPRHPPNLEYITAIESVCTKLGQQELEELRADINRVLRSSHPINLI